MKRGFSYIIIFCLLVSSILLPYAKINEPSILSSITTFFTFFSMPLIFYYLGLIYEENKQSRSIAIIFFVLINLVINIINLITKNNLTFPVYNTGILLSFILYTYGSKYFHKEYLIFPLLIISLLIGFIPNLNSLVATLIGYFPLYLMGYTNLFKKINTVKLINKFKNIFGIICLIFPIIMVILIPFKFHISYNVLELLSYYSHREIIYRFGYLALAIIFIYGIDTILKPKEIKLNNLYILGISPLFIHLFNHLVSIKYYSNWYLLYTLGLILILIIIGEIPLLDKITSKLIDSKKENLGILATLVILVLILLIPNLKKEYLDYPIYSLMSEKEKTEIDNSITISFVGDLIMLENQVKSGYDGENYNYDLMFKYASKYLKSSDYSIGVLEGPVSSYEYSSGNFDDLVPLHLNYPKEFAQSIKNSGIDLVTIANNHILDRSLEGLKETETNLNELGLAYVGTKQNRYQIVDIKGLKVGILAYTYGANYYEEKELIKMDEVPLIVSPGSLNFKKIKKQVIKDFDNLKKEKVDLIIVLPHMGTQFSHETDPYQNTWNKIFVENGADIIFGDHAHAVEPIEYLENSIIINSPGNFANQYIKHDGDATSIVEVNIDPTTKQVIASSIVPMYTMSNEKGFYYALPIVEALNNLEVNSTLSQYELKRINEVFRLTTKVMLKEELSIDNIEDKLYYFKDGYKRRIINNEPISSTNDLNTILENSKTVCFIGDSITEGSVNGGYPYYEPLLKQFNFEAKNVSKGSYTTKLLLKYKSNEIKVCKADTFVIAIGTNDVRYRNQKTCAMDSKEYIMEINKIIQIIEESNNNPNIVLIAPWYSTNKDTMTPLSHAEKLTLYHEYEASLKTYASENNYLYINPNPVILETIYNQEHVYLKDFIHPNKRKGIYLYSYAVLNSKE